MAVFLGNCFYGLGMIIDRKFVTENIYKKKINQKLVKGHITHSNAKVALKIY